MAQEDKKSGGVRGMFTTVWVSVEYISVHLVDALLERFQKAREEVDLFLGATLALLGFLNWSSAKYCDGNTSDYLSCTRPATYYYYGAFEIALILLGVLLILSWWVSNRKGR